MDGQCNGPLYQETRHTWTVERHIELLIEGGLNSGSRFKKNHFLFWVSISVWHGSIKHVRKAPIASISRNTVLCAICEARNSSARIMSSQLLY
jgi:hypothetical protein